MINVIIDILKNFSLKNLNETNSETHLIRIRNYQINNDELVRNLLRFVFMPLQSDLLTPLLWISILFLLRGLINYPN